MFSIFDSFFIYFFNLNDYKSSLKDKILKKYSSNSNISSHQIIYNGKESLHICKLNQNIDLINMANNLILIKDILWNDYNFDVSNIYIKNEYNLVISNKYKKTFDEVKNKKEVIALLFYLFLKLIIKHNLIINEIKLDDFNFLEENNRLIINIKSITKIMKADNNIKQEILDILTLKKNDNPFQIQSLDLLINLKKAYLPKKDGSLYIKSICYDNLE